MTPRSERRARSRHRSSSETSALRKKHLLARSSPLGMLDEDIPDCFRFREVEFPAQRQLRHPGAHPLCGRPPRLHVYQSAPPDPSINREGRTMTDPMTCFRSYCRAVEALLDDGYALSLADAGIERSELAIAFAGRECPAAFVHWLAAKRDLTSRSDWSLEHARDLVYTITQKGDTPCEDLAQNDSHRSSSTRFAPWPRTAPSTTSSPSPTSATPARPFSASTPQMSKASTPTRGVSGMASGSVSRTAASSTPMETPRGPTRRSTTRWRTDSACRAQERHFAEARDAARPRDRQQQATSALPVPLDRRIPPLRRVFS